MDKVDKLIASMFEDDASDHELETISDRCLIEKTTGAGYSTFLTRTQLLEGFLGRSLSQPEHDSQKKINERGPNSHRRFVYFGILHAESLSTYEKAQVFYGSASFIPFRKNTVSITSPDERCNCKLVYDHIERVVDTVSFDFRDLRRMIGCSGIGFLSLWSDTSKFIEGWYFADNCENIQAGILRTMGAANVTKPDYLRFTYDPANPFTCIALPIGHEYGETSRERADRLHEESWNHGHHYVVSPPNSVEHSLRVREGNKCVCDNCRRPVPTGVGYIFVEGALGRKLFPLERHYLAQASKSSGKKVGEFATQILNLPYSISLRVFLCAESPERLRFSRKRDCTMVYDVFDDTLNFLRYDGFLFTQVFCTPSSNARFFCGEVEKIWRGSRPSPCSWTCR
jgi:hypothetical protein